MINLNISKIYKERRQKLINTEESSCFIFIGSNETKRNHDVSYPFRQNSDFYYLTGLEEPKCVLLLINSPELGNKEVLFLQDSNPNLELWEGELYGVTRAKEVFNVDETHNINNLEKLLPEYILNLDSIYYSHGNDKDFDEILNRCIKSNLSKKGRSGMGKPTIKDFNDLLGSMRIIKDQSEIDLMKKSAKISALAHKKVMENLKPGMNEQQVYALLQYEFLFNGHKRLAYESIVAGGKNACCLHYTANNEELVENDLILIDAGGEFEYYASDITRTFPVGKSFTKSQKLVYQIVLDIQKDVINMIKPGVSFKVLNDFVDQKMAQALIDLGVFKKSLDEIINNKLHKKYYPHGLGHWLGLDVHDKGLYFTDKHSTNYVLFKAGMALTIEPGLYFPKDDQNIPQELRGIGIRIEDDIIVTEDGCINLTLDVPKEINEIEALRNNAY